MCTHMWNYDGQVVNWGCQGCQAGAMCSSVTVGRTPKLSAHLLNKVNFSDWGSNPGCPGKNHQTPELLYHCLAVMAIAMLFTTSMNGLAHAMQATQSTTLVLYLPIDLERLLEQIITQPHCFWILLPYWLCQYNSKDSTLAIVCNWFYNLAQSVTYKCQVSDSKLRLMIMCEIWAVAQCFSIRQLVEFF